MQELVNLVIAPPILYITGQQKGPIAFKSPCLLYVNGKKNPRTKNNQFYHLTVLQQWNNNQCNIIIFYEW